MLRTGSILAALTLLSACTTPASGLKGGETPPLISDARYKLEAEQAPELIALAQHPDGLSEHQRAALNDYARGYIEAGADRVTIRTPAGAGQPAARVAEGAKAVLEAAGLSDREVALGTYASDKPDAPVQLVYDHWRAKPIACGKWENLTATRDNQPQSNFGCAETANMAAQVADPRDIRAPHALDPSDAGRRAAIMDKYRKGEVTAGAWDERARGNVTQTVQ